MSASVANPKHPPAVRALLDLSGQAVLVTGAGSGIGRAIAARFAEAGARVAVHHHTSRDGARVVVDAIRAAGGDARSFEADLTRAAELDGVARFVARAPLGRLGQPHDVADACLFLASRAARFVTGATLVVDGGVLAAPAF